MDIAVINTVLTGVYVLLTLIIAGAAIWSIRVTSKQSRNALGASDRQSAAAIAAVREQIVVSENQAKEALFNQHKPVIGPTSRLSGLDILKFTMHNKGTGIALNTWGILSIVSTKKFYRFDYAYF